MLVDVREGRTRRYPVLFKVVTEKPHLLRPLQKWDIVMREQRPCCTYPPPIYRSGVVAMLDIHVSSTPPPLRQLCYLDADFTPRNGNPEIN